MSWVTMAADLESDSIYLSTQFWNDAHDEIPKKNFELIYGHIKLECDSMKKLYEYFQSRYVKIQKRHFENQPARYIGRGVL